MRAASLLMWLFASCLTTSKQDTASAGGVGGGLGARDSIAEASTAASSSDAVPGIQEAMGLEDVVFSADIPDGQGNLLGFVLFRHQQSNPSVPVQKFCGMHAFQPVEACIEGIMSSILANVPGIDPAQAGMRTELKGPIVSILFPIDGMVMFNESVRLEVSIESFDPEVHGRITAQAVLEGGHGSWGQFFDVMEVQITDAFRNLPLAYGEIPSLATSVSGMCATRA